MSATPEELRELLSRLDRELHEVDRLDEASRALLREVSRDISAVLERAEPQEARSEATASAISDGSLIERITATVEDYETAHPAIAGLLRRMIDGLAQLGI